MRAVIDTNVVFEGLTRKGGCAQVMDAWADRKFVPCVSTALALEYEAVLSRKLKPAKADLALTALQALLSRCEYAPIFFRWRPASPDPGDDMIVECVLNSQSVLVTKNLKDFRRAAREFRFAVLNPSEWMELIESRSQK